MLNYYQKLQLWFLAWKRKCVKRSVLVSFYVYISTVDTKIFYTVDTKIFYAVDTKIFYFYCRY